MATAAAMPAGDRADRDASAPVRRVAVLADDEHGGAGRDQLAAPAPARGRGCAARWRTPSRPGRGRPARAGRAGTGPSAATRPGTGPPPSASARPSRRRPGPAAPEQGERRAAAHPVARAPARRVGIGQQPLRSRRPGVDAAAAAGLAGQRPRTAAIITSVAANVIVEGPCSSPARVSSATSASRASEFASPFVTDRDPGPVAALDERVDEAHELGALAGLADADQQRVRVERASRKCSSSAASTIVASTPAAASRVTAG